MFKFCNIMLNIIKVRKGSILALLTRYWFISEEIELNKSMNLYKDILVGLFYLGGTIGPMPGQFLIPAALIRTASLVSHFHFR